VKWGRVSVIAVICRSAERSGRAVEEPVTMVTLLTTFSMGTFARKREGGRGVYGTFSI
jgi:hypothetical protein